MDAARLDFYPEDVRCILAALGKVMGSGRLHPGLVRDNASAWEDVLEGHFVAIKHTPKSELGGKSGRYEIAVHGKRWGGSTWTFWSGQLEELARKATE